MLTITMSLKNTLFLLSWNLYFCYRSHTDHQFCGNRLPILEVTHFKFLVLAGVKGRSLQCPTVFWQIKWQCQQSRNC